MGKNWHEIFEREKSNRCRGGERAKNNQGCHRSLSSNLSCCLQLKENWLPSAKWRFFNFQQNFYRFCFFSFISVYFPHFFHFDFFFNIWFSSLLVCVLQIQLHETINLNRCKSNSSEWKKKHSIFFFWNFSQMFTRTNEYEKRNKNLKLETENQIMFFCFQMHNANFQLAIFDLKKNRTNMHVYVCWIITTQKKKNYRLMTTRGAWQYDIVWRQNEFEQQMALTVAKHKEYESKSVKFWRNTFQRKFSFFLVHVLLNWIEHFRC